MNNGVTKDNLLQALPSVLDQDAGMRPLGETAAEALAALWESVDLPAIYSRIDELPETLLDILAKDFKIDWYNFNHDVATKRAVIKGSFFVHKHMGTVGAVKRALDGMYDFRLEEWYQYAGDPYHFRVHLYGAYTQEGQDWAFRAIGTSKNVRSTLDTIIFHQPEIIGQNNLFAGVGLYNVVLHSLGTVETPDFDDETICADGLSNPLTDGFGVILGL